MKIRTLILYFSFITTTVLYSQSEPGKIFLSIENGINAADVSQFTGYIREKAYISLLNGYSDYFSPNQAHYVLQDFFNYYEPIEFKLEDKNFDEQYCFATGVLTYFHRGAKKNGRVFISLKKTEKHWEISQLTIN